MVRAAEVLDRLLGVDKSCALLRLRALIDLGVANKASILCGTSTSAVVPNSC